MKHRHSLGAWIALVILALAAGCEGDTIALYPNSVYPGGPGQGIVTVNSDYTDSTVSVVDRLSGTLGIPEIASSTGSAGLSSPLSGDVVPARAPNPFGAIILLDRSNANLTFVGPGTRQIEDQFSARTNVGDPNPNPSDALVVDGGRIYVSRQGRFNFGAATAFDDENSNDVVEMDPVTGALTEVPAFDFNVSFGAAGTGQVDTANADYARPNRLLRIGNYVAAILLNLDGGFDGTGGTGLVAILDPATDTLVDATPTTAGTTDPVVIEDGADVCQGPGGGASYLPESGILYIACSGIPGNFFSPANGDYAGQLANSMVVAVDFSPLAAGGDVTVTEIALASDFYPGATPGTQQSPLSGAVQVVSPTLGFAVVYGTFGCGADPCVPDNSAPPANVSSAVLSFNPTSGTVYTTAIISGGPYELGGLLGDALTSRAYLADGQFVSPKVRVIDFDAALSGGVIGTASENVAAAFVPNSRPGQAPRELAYY